MQWSLFVTHAVDAEVPLISVHGNQVLVRDQDLSPVHIRPIGSYVLLLRSQADPVTAACHGTSTSISFGEEWSFDDVLDPAPPTSQSMTLTTGLWHPILARRYPLRLSMLWLRPQPCTGNQREHGRRVV